MSNPFANPLVRYGIAAMNAAIVVAVAFLFVDGGTLRTLLLGIAVLEVVVTPFVLARAADAG